MINQLLSGVYLGLLEDYPLRSRQSDPDGGVKDESLSPPGPTAVLAIKELKACGR